MRFTKKAIAMFLALTLTFLSDSSSYARGTTSPILPTDVTEASSNCVLVGVYGSYASDVEAALARINAIRKEACDNGYRNPVDSSKRLTPEDYVPLKWSSDLEYIARIRAAEASILSEHARPNGEHWGNLASPNGLYCLNEVLAWQSWEGTLVNAINNWYREKNAWVNNTGGVTGHYTAMINPKYKFTGISTFNSPTSRWHSSSAGKFSSRDDLDQTPGKASSNCLQTLELMKTNLSVPFIAQGTSPVENLDASLGKTIDLDLMRMAIYEGDQSLVYVLGNIIWKSSDTSVAIVDTNGKVTFVGAGSATISAISDDGSNASVTVKSKVTIKTPTLRTLKAGKKKCTVKWRKVSGNGYELQYSNRKSFRTFKSKVFTKATTTSTVLKKLKSKKKYYVRIRTIKNVNGTKYYSSWSKKKSVKIK